MPARTPAAEVETRTLAEPAGGSAYGVSQASTQGVVQRLIVTPRHGFPRHSYVGSRDGLTERPAKLLTEFDDRMSDRVTSSSVSQDAKPRLGTRVVLTPPQSARADRLVFPAAVVLALGDLVTLMTWAARLSWKGPPMFYIVLIFAVIVTAVFVVAVAACRHVWQLAALKVLLGFNFPLVMFFSDQVPSDVLLARLAFVAPQVVLLQLRQSDLDLKFINAPAAESSAAGPT